VGALYLAFCAFLIVAWVASGDFQRTTVGSDSPPHWMRVLARLNEIGTLLVVVVIAYFVILRPWRRERRLSLDGTILIAGMSVVFLDLFQAYFRPWFTYNTVLTNFGSWGNHVPGLITPHANMFAEPTLWLLAAFPMWYMIGIGLGGVMLRKLAARWPNTGIPGRLLSILVPLIVLDLVIEVFWVRSGLFSIPGAWGPTLFKGHYYQFPIAEAVCSGALWTSVIALRYFKNDRGETFAERGLDEFRGDRKRAGLRLLAIIGAVNVLSFVVYYVPVALLGSKADPWIDDIVRNRSYLTSQLCGHGTDYVCTAPGWHRAGQP
jgi:hypothetical protein